AVVEMGGEHFELQVEDALEEADLYESALAGQATAHEAGEDAPHEVRAGHQVGDGEAHRHGTLIGVAREPGEAGERLRQQVLARLVPPRTAVAVAGDR